MDDQHHHPYENLQLNIAGHAHYEYSEVACSYVPMHWHDALELIYILSGELTVETEQRRWQLHAGQCICISGIDGGVSNTPCDRQWSDI